MPVKQALELPPEILVLEVANGMPLHKFGGPIHHKGTITQGGSGFCESLCHMDHRSQLSAWHYLNRALEQLGPVAGRVYRVEDSLSTTSQLLVSGTET